MGTQRNVSRPMRQLLTLMPRVQVDADGQPDFDASAPELLVQIAESAELLQRVIALGTSAVGQLMAFASADVDTGEVGQDAIEALGWLIAEMCDGAAACLVLAAPCRRVTADFTGARDGEAQ
ncbi:MAG: hypothetical protein JF607_03495 [Burkholderiales bacterium]|nr:hypothetical protein [Burkholderiales bacterium]